MAMKTVFSIATLRRSIVCLPIPQRNTIVRQQNTTARPQSTMRRRQNIIPKATTLRQAITRILHRVIMRTQPIIWKRQQKSMSSTLLLHTIRIATLFALWEKHYSYASPYFCIGVSFCEDASPSSRTNYRASFIRLILSYIWPSFLVGSILI